MNKRLTRFAAVALTAILFACAAEYAHAMAAPAVTGTLAPAKSQQSAVKTQQSAVKTEPAAAKP